MSLFKTIEEVEAVCRANKGLDVGTFRIYELEAIEKYIRRFTGDNLINEVEVWYADETPEEDSPEAALLPYLQACIGKFALAIGAPDLDVNLSESGFGVVNNQNLAPASKDRVAAFIKNQEELGYLALERMLRFLEENKDDYESWTDSEGYTTKWDFFIPNAAVFSKIIPINESRKTYFDMMPAMSLAEAEHITPKLGIDFASKLKLLQKEDGLTGEYLEAMKLVQKAAAYFTMFASTNDDQYYRHGSVWMNAMVKYLQDNADALTEFKEGEAYQEDGITPAFENDTDNGVFVFSNFPIK